MKKLLILLLAAMMIICVFTFSACGGDGEQANGNSTSYSEEESSSKTKNSRGPIGVNPGGDGDNSTTIPTSSGGNTNTSSSTPSQVTPQGEGYYIRPSTAPDTASTEAKFLVLAINSIESVTPENFREKGINIKDCETEYNKLTAAQKAEVVNYQDLVNARAKFNEFQGSAILVEFEQLVTDLPEAVALKNADVPNVNKAWKMMNDNQAQLQKGLANFADLKTKLTACNNRVLSCTVEIAYIAQDGNGNGVLEASVVDKNGDTRSEITSPKKRGKDFDKVTNPFGIVESSVSGSVSDGGKDHSYTDTKNPNPVTIFQYTKFKTFTFNATNPGKLTLYVRLENNKKYSVIQGGETIFSKDSGDTVETCKYEIDVQAGQTTVKATNTSGSDSEGYLVAVKFSYPDIK